MELPSEKVFKITKDITLKVKDGKTNICVKGELFQHLPSIRVIRKKNEHLITNENFRNKFKNIVFAVLDN